MFTNLRELILSMPTETECREYLAKQRWADGRIVCPYCNNPKSYVIENGQRYKCASNTCYKRFTVTVGTVMEASNIPVSKWLTAIYLLTAHKKGISSYQLGRDLGIAQKNSWFMLHRIREMLRTKQNVKLDNIVEIDEVYIGGKVGNMSKSKRTKLRETGMTMHTKTMVMGMLERGGNLKLIPVGKAYNTAAIQPAVRENVDTDAVLITDSHVSYTGLNKEFAGHEVVRHAEQEFVKDGVIHTNSIEGAFSLLKRSIIGIYHQVTPKHLSRYCDETMFRYNLRKMKDSNRFAYSLMNVNGRLTYKQLISTNKVPHTISVQDGVVLPQLTESNDKRVRAVYQMKDGQVIGCFPTIKEAAKVTGISKQNISHAARGTRQTAGGCQWKFA